MGFSVSGSAALVFAGLFISFGIFYGATSNSFERVSDAQEDRSDAVVDQKNTGLTIATVERDSLTNRLTVLVNNTGSRALSVNRTDFFVDNDYRTGWQADAQVDGNAATDLWLPGEQLNITVRIDAPSRVKVVSESGVADTAEVN